METNIQKNDFLFFTAEEIEEKNYIHEISKLIKKYNILKDENELIGPKDKNHLYIINYTLNLLKSNIELPIDLKNLFLSNITLKRDINLYLENKVSNLLKDDNNLILKDINILISITAIGSNERILNSNYSYNLDALSKCFRFYEIHLQNLFKNNEKLFNITFDTYVILLKSLFYSLIVSSTNILRNSFIKNMMELITESINIIKYNILLNNVQLSRINNILGRYLYIFSHLENIKVNKDDLNSTFNEFIFIFSRQEDGFNLSKNNYFGYENSFNYESEFILHKNYSAIFLLKLIKKLKDIDYESYKDNPLFRKILNIYYKRFSTTDNFTIPNSFVDIKNNLLNSLILNYNSDISFEKRQNYKFVLEDFLLNDKIFDNKNIEVIYRILYFADDLEEYKYSHAASILINSNPILNGYQEFFKLTTFDLYLSKIKQKEALSYEEIELLEKIMEYCIKNNCDIHLKSILTKIYLNIAYIFSKHKIKIDLIEKSYALILLFSNFSSIENNYGYQNLLIMKYLNVSPLDVEKEFVVNYFTKNLKILEEIVENNLSKNLSTEDKVTFFKNLLHKELFYYIANIEFTDDLNKYTNYYELEVYIHKIDYKNNVIFLYTKLNEEIFHRIFKISKIFILDKLQKLFIQTNKNSADYYLTNDDLIF